MGTPNQNTPADVMRATWKMPIRTKGMVFPRMNSMGLTGVTMICSMVPTSFSLTMAMAVRLSTETMITSAMIPGT